MMALVVGTKMKMASHRYRKEGREPKAWRGW